MRLYLLDLFDPVLQDGHHGVLAAQPGQPAAGGVVLGGFDRQDHHLDRAGDVVGICVHRAGHHDGVRAVGPQFDAVPRGVAAQQHPVAGRVQQRGHRRADGAGADHSDVGCDEPKVPGSSGDRAGP
ncbi:hypothetical protein BZL30_8828 [Mycobacterium kansasii]|uniref:Uncharacterized protein n=1 Tax=Mycobacterium kansasii TaxID=1768 RepID=A0A1V3WDH0_MYCKA|nr:hypothetical protein BZL30_8828 [Mycobacterium kansasii]